MKRAASIGFFLAVAACLCAGQSAAKDTPRNGGFEQVAGGRPIGWQLYGPWKLDESSPHSGKYAVRLDANDSLHWNKVLSANFVARVYEGDELVLRCFYKSTTGNADIGVGFCDECGEHVKWGGVAAAGPARDWTPLERRFTVDAELRRLGVRTVKVYAQVTKTGSDACYDDISLEIKRKSPEAVVTTKAVRIDPLKQKEILREGFESVPDGRPPGWKVMTAPDEPGKIEQDAKVRREGRSALRISGVKRRVVLFAPPVRIDPKVSCAVSCWMKCEATERGRGILKVVLLDEEAVPTGEPFSKKVGYHCEFMEKRIEIPWNEIPSDAVQMQITIGVNGECPGKVWFDDLRVVPRVLTVSAASSAPHNLFHAGEPARLFLKMYNCCLEDARYEVSVALEDFRGNQTTLTKEEVRLAPRKPVEKTIDLKFPALGYFKATISASKEGETVSELNEDIALVTPFSEEIFAQDSPFGSHHNGMRPEFINLMREAYVKWVRIGAGWGGVERERGKYNWTGLERNYRVYFDNGFNLLAIVSGCPEWNSSYKEGMPKTHWGGTHDAYPPADYGPWKDFCAAIAAHFKGRISYWEVRNEPNVSVFWMGTPQDYAKLLRTAYTGLHQGNPDCRVIFEVAGTDMAYYSAVYRAGGEGYCDILGTHNYQLSHPGPPEKSTFLREYYDMRKFLARHGEADKPIWDTEFCWMSAPPRDRRAWKGVGEKNQADYLVRSWTLALSAGVVKVFWFPFYSYGGAELNEPHPGGLVRADCSIKPVFVAHRTMAEHLVGAKYSREIHVGRGARCYVFSKDGSEIAVAWAIEGEQQVSLATNAERVRIFDIMNNPGTLRTRGGLLTFTATGSPTYLVSPTPFKEANGAVSERLLLRLHSVRAPGKFEREVKI